jgi:RHS repeat-associated protein
MRAVVRGSADSYVYDRTTVVYLHHDQQGSTRLLTSSTGVKEASFTYGPYGGVIGSTGTATTPLGYDAQYTSQDTGLVYMRDRVYDPTTSQFLTSDPAVGVTRAPYNYVGDSPVNHRDPTGLSAEGLEGVPCYFPFCGPPPPAGEGVQHGLETVGHGLESAWNFVTEKEAPHDEGEAELREKQAQQAECRDPIPETLKKWVIVTSSESSRRRAPIRTPIRPRRLEEMPDVTTTTGTRPRVKSISRRKVAVSQSRRG